MSRFERYTTVAIGGALLLLVNTGCEHNSLSPEQQSLEEIAALPQSSYHAIDFIDSKLGWVVGNGGAIFHSVDGGKTWVYQTSGTSDDLYRVQFVDRDFGWIAGTRSLLHTEDGGNSWQEQRADSSFGRFVSMQFVDRSEGWLTGPVGGGLYHLTASGRRWETITLPDFGRVSSISFIDARVGYVLFASGRLFRTTDGGARWTQVAQPRFGFCMDFVTPETGFVGNMTMLSSRADDWANIFRTDDGGETWVAQTLPKCTFVLKIAFADPWRGWALTGGSTATALLHTEDGGATWRAAEIDETEQGFTDFTIVDANHVWVLGTTGRLYRISR